MNLLEVAHIKLNNISAMKRSLVHMANLFVLLLVFFINNAAFANEYEQNDCNGIIFLKDLTKNNQPITSECSDFKFCKSKMLTT